eukprot:GHVN01092018.1.p1 GENE.GHVN01092018.1~~GHVN01092018.1.p1  ORF type:complete len:245 (+),score=16.45 GHVN01092018.1:311-1045(+)
MGTVNSTLRPGVMSELIKDTQFSHAEIGDLYRQFLADAHPGMVLEKHHFQKLYSTAYPLGNSDDFTGFVFRMFNKEQTGQVTFQTQIMTLHAPLKGTEQEKIAWLFNFYADNADGRVYKQELVNVVQSIDKLNGEHLYCLRQVSPTQCVDYIFSKCAHDNKDYLTVHDFTKAATTSDTLQYVMQATMNACLTPYTARKASTGSYGKARSNSVLSARRRSRSSSTTSSGSLKERDLIDVDLTSAK